MAMLDEKAIKSYLTMIAFALLAIWLANNVREIGNLVRPKTTTA